MLTIPGAAFSAWSVARLWCGAAARGWPVARGEVVESAVRERRGKRGPFWVLRVRYRYAVGGRAFTARRRSFRVLSPAFVVPSAA